MKKPAVAPSIEELLTKLVPQRLLDILTLEPSSTGQQYYHWDELRRRDPPHSLSHQEWWLKLKFARCQTRRSVPLTDSKGNPFSYCLADNILEKLQLIDARASNNMVISEKLVNSGQRDRYAISSLIEEAITSSQLEGAITTRKDAADMLRSGRAPRDKSEQMILNNFRAMQKILTMKDQEITPERICELHRIVTEHMLEDDTGAGRIQRPDDKRVAVWDETTGDILHQPPPAKKLAKRMKKMCAFANNQNADGPYMHSLIRAIILHFWLAYDHPFEDANGRTARALFYWLMLKQGYWLFAFISISSLLKKSPASYAKSFLYTETDENDLSYFIIYQLKIILRSIKKLEKYISRKTNETQALDGQLNNRMAFNHRQKALIAHALKTPGTVYSIESHRLSHQISYATSRADLMKLEELDLLRQFKVGKGFRYKAVEHLQKALQQID